MCYFPFLACILLTCCCIEEEQIYQERLQSLSQAQARNAQPSTVIIVSKARLSDHIKPDTVQMERIQSPI